MGIADFYKRSYRKLMLIPIIVLLLSFAQIGWQISTTGDFVNKGVSLKGGSTITTTGLFDAAKLEQKLKNAFPSADIGVRTLSSAGEQIGVTIDSSYQTEPELEKLRLYLKNLGVPRNEQSVEITGSTLGESFFRQTFAAMIIAFILMGIVVLLYFRSLVPAFAVIAAAFSDIVVVLALFNLTGIKLTTAGIAAFLMLIGYSVDTDILLSC